eukprot:3133285-Rhodomonas_salina.1
MSRRGVGVGVGGQEDSNGVAVMESGRGVAESGGTGDLREAGDSERVGVANFDSVSLSGVHLCAMRCHKSLTCRHWVPLQVLISCRQHASPGLWDAA